MILQGSMPAGLATSVDGTVGGQRVSVTPFSLLLSNTAVARGVAAQACEVGGRPKPSVLDRLQRPAAIGDDERLLEVSVLNMPDTSNVKVQVVSAALPLSVTRRMSTRGFL